MRIFRPPRCHVAMDECELELDVEILNVIYLLLRIMVYPLIAILSPSTPPFKFSLPTCYTPSLLPMFVDVFEKPLVSSTTKGLITQYPLWGNDSRITLHPETLECREPGLL